MKNLRYDRVSSVEPLERRTLMSITMVHDLDSDASAGRPAFRFTVSNGIGFFTRNGDSSSGTLWRTDGVNASIVYGGFDLFVDFDHMLPVDVGIAAMSNHGSMSQMWRSDGTTAGTYALGTVPSVHTDVGTISPIRSLHGRYYVSDENFSNAGIYESDGNTFNSLGRVPGAWGSIAEVPDGVVFTGGINDNGALYRIDNNGQVTQYVDHATLGGNPNDASKLGTQVIFDARPIAGGSFGIWLTDGTAQGTHPLAIPATGSPTDEFVIGSDGSRALINVHYADGTNSIWSTDGTSAGTRQILPNLPEDLRIVGSINGRTLFTDNSANAMLWSTDGTAAGTQVLTHFAPGTEFVNYLGAVYFANTDPVHGTELWRTDGTPARTGLYADVTPGPDSSNPRPYGVVGRHMLFGVGTDLRNGAILSLTNPLQANPPVDEAGPPVTLGTSQLIRDDALGLQRTDDLV